MPLPFDTSINIDVHRPFAAIGRHAYPKPLLNVARFVNLGPMSESILPLRRAKDCTMEPETAGSV
jgi:hypothetical protein